MSSICGCKQFSVCELADDVEKVARGFRQRFHSIISRKKGSNACIALRFVKNELNIQTHPTVCVSYVVENLRNIINLTQEKIYSSDNFLDFSAVFVSHEKSSSSIPLALRERILIHVEEMCMHVV